MPIFCSFSILFNLYSLHHWPTRYQDINEGKNTLPTDASMLTPQEVMGTYHLDSRGSERRWLPPTLPNCENSLSLKKHQDIYSVAVRMCYMSLVFETVSSSSSSSSGSTPSALSVQSVCSVLSQLEPAVQNFCRPPLVASVFTETWS